jgi:transaldolase
MRIFVDSADHTLVTEALAYGYVYGVTTNPTLLRRVNLRAAELPALVQHVLERGAREVHLQVYSSDQQQMIRESETLLAIASDQVVVKIPATAPGYAAAAHLTARGVRVTLTAVYTLRQALLAQSVGASYIAVYLGRMRDDGHDPFAIIGQMQTLLTAQRSTVEILAASIREPAEVEALGALGVAAATIAPPVLAQLLQSPATERAATTFGEDARAIQ